MERTEVLERLTDIFRKVFKNDTLEISDELTANDVDHWDSLKHMLLIGEIEEDFSIKFKLRDLDKMQNVGNLVDMIISKL
ncbi:MAG: acyl carrier protein [Bacteroidales bacterium]|nr:acyl carrier protein [Bacteroidales bacterium]